MENVLLKYLLAVCILIQYSFTYIEKRISYENDCNINCFYTYTYDQKETFYLSLSVKGQVKNYAELKEKQIYLFNHFNRKYITYIYIL